MEGAAALGGGGGGDIHRLPEGCISHVLSLTSPRDACRSAAVSWTFRAAAESDAVWEKFLPPDYREIISRAAPPVEYSSKKELYFRLCGSIPIDGGGKSFALERSTGRKCLMLSARELVIVWGDTPHYWKWVSLPESRFSEVAELLDVCWLEIRGTINSRMLSQNTSYVAYFVFKLTEDSFGLGRPPQEASVKLGSHASEQAVRLHPEEPEPRWPNPHFGLLHFPDPHPLPPATPPASPPPMLPLPLDVPAPAQEEACMFLPAEGDGWMEIEIGEFSDEMGDDGAHASEQFVRLHPEEPEPRRRIPRFGLRDFTDFPHPPPPALPPAALPPMLPLPLDVPDPAQEEACKIPQARGDGWMEIEIGEFFNENGDDGEVEMCLKEIRGGHWKTGLIVEGIEVQPRT